MTADSSICGWLVEHRLDLAGRDVLAAADDQVLLAAGDEQVAVLVQVADVAGVQPAVDWIAAAVASACLWYSVMMRGPMTQISPSSPAASDVVVRRP